MPEARLVDTNVLVCFVRRDPLAAAYLPHLEGREGIISFITLGELLRWPVQERWRADRVAALDQYLAGFTVRHSDGALCRTWAQMVGQLARAGRTLSVADSWIAATARSLRIPLVSHNRRDFAGVTGLQLISEAPA